MIVQLIYGELDRKSYYSQSDADIYAAMNSAGWTIFTRILREQRGYFIKEDTTSLVLVPGTQEYKLPADVSQILHLAERATTSENWHQMRAISLDDALQDAQDATGYSSYYGYGYFGTASPFGFYGPYLAAADTGTNPQKLTIDIAPAIDQTRMTQIVYTAKWIPIRDGSTTIYLPDEAESALIDLACVELLRNNDDTLADRYKASSEEKIQWLTSFIRQRQLATPPRIKMFGDSDSDYQGWRS